jgi:Uma2 family endonuclease
LLVVEISDSSLGLDRRKAGLYAAAGVPEYWIVNLAARCVEVFRRPTADASQQFGHRYAEEFAVPETGTIAPAAKPDDEISVRTFFE